MRYSLGSRFRGTLLGLLLGQTLVRDGEQQSPSYFDVTKMAVQGAESLIALGKLDLNDWQERQQQKSLYLDQAESFSLQVILASIPIALFFHDNKIKLRQNLINLWQIREDNPVIRDGTLAIGYAIAKSLTEKLEPQILISEIVSFLGETSTSVPQELIKVNKLLVQGAGLERVQAELSKQDKWSQAIAMAFYCFLSTLEDFRLAVSQAIHNSNYCRQDAWPWRSQTIGAITGALSGAYNGSAGIPVKWQVGTSTANPAVCEVTSFSQMLELANALVAVWSGMYDLTLNPKEEHPLSEEQNPLCVYSAPRVIRSR